jgi:hypothetical protein
MWDAPMTRRAATILLALAMGALAAAPASAHHGSAPPPPQPTLLARAILPADATSAAPFPGAPNTEPAPAPGSVQPVGGFSALLDAPGFATYWAMPDNGFGTKANSQSFLLRVYKLHADFETARGGAGAVEVLRSITLRDPDHRIAFKLINDATPDRLLTGGDFDIESVRVDHRGTLWFGDEFGPFLVHTDATGKVLEAPVPLPDVKSPDYPPDYPSPVAGAANLAGSNGFEGMAISPDGRTLYPTLEGPVAGDDPLTRRMYEFDIPRRRYTSTRRTYRMDDPTFLLSDLTALDRHRLVARERDNTQGATTVHKQGFVIDLRRVDATGALVKRQVLDLERLRDPARISLPARPGDLGLGDPFAMPYQTIEAVLPLLGDRVAVVNDTNFGSTGRNPSLPDYSDFIVVSVPGLRDGGHW